MAGTSAPKPSSDVLKILVASDMHLGYGERDPIRSEDSFVTFAEVFQIALEQQVDMVLLAGDLFHDNRPSRKALQRCMEVMRDYCLGDRKVEMEVVSDQHKNFHSKYHSVNFEDPHYNVQLPVFSIHGNHDDPAGDGGLAALDLLSTANLINYFGRQDNFEKITLSPVLIQKGKTKLALYGIGHVRDERLNRCLERKEVKVARPVDDRDKWFSILALHQNRLPRGAGIHAKGYIKEHQLPSCIDLAIWGHEHECLIGGGMAALPDSAGNDFVVMQPGSTVATALVEGEARPKHVGLISICEDAWQMQAIPLTTVRPFAIREVVLRDYEEDVDMHREEPMMDFLAEQVEAMLEELKARHTSTPLTAHAENCQRYPLVRLKVDYGGYSTCNPQRFGQRFVDRVANPSDILLFQKTKVKRREEKAAEEAAKRRRGDPCAAEGLAPAETENAADELQSLVSDFLSDGKDSLRLLPQHELNTAVFMDYVFKDNRNAIRNHVEGALKRTQAFLASEARDAVDAQPERKLKQEAVEQQVEKITKRLSASHRARVQSGVLPTSDSFVDAADTHVEPHERSSSRGDIGSTSSNGHRAHVNAAAVPTRGSSGAQIDGAHLDLPSADDALFGDAPTGTGVAAPVPAPVPVTSTGTSRQSPSRETLGARRSSASVHAPLGGSFSDGGDGMPAPRVAEPRAPEVRPAESPSAARAADPLAKTPASDRGCGSGARTHSGSMSPLSRVAPLSISGGVNRQPVSRLSFEPPYDDCATGSKARAPANQPSASTAGSRGTSSNLARRPATAFRDDDAMLQDEESEDPGEVPSWLANAAAPSSRAGGSSFTSRRRKR